MSESRPRTDLIVPAQLQREREEPPEAPPQRIRRPLPVAGPRAFLTLILLTLIAFSPLLFSPVLWTQYDQVERSAFQRLDHWTEAWHPETIRQENPFSLTLDFAETALPLPPAALHRGINILLHLGAAFLLLANLQALHMRRAFFASLLFAIHPAVVQTLFWPGYRAPIVALILILSALYFAIRNRGGFDLLASLGLTVLACLADPAAFAIPFIVALVVVARRQHLQLRDFNRVLPLGCVVLLMAIAMAAGKPEEALSPDAGALETVNAAGLNLIFYLRQAFFPFQPALFHSYESLRVGSYRGDSFLPFLFFVPILILIGFNFSKPWARALLLGIGAYMALVAHGLFARGLSLAGQPALEDNGQYIALPVIVALAVAGGDFLIRKLGDMSKPLWSLFAAAIFLVALSVTTAFAIDLRNPRLMWSHIIEFWPEEWPAKQALAEYYVEHREELGDREELVSLLNTVLNQRPEEIHLRTALARLYSELRQWTNATREYQRVLRESEPSADFLREAVDLFQANGMLWEARNARERLEKRTAE